MSDDDEPSFWKTLPGILTGLAALITAIAGFWALIVYDRAPESSPPPVEAVHQQSDEAAASEASDDASHLEIVEINSHSPDYVVLRNRGPLPIDLSGLVFREGSHECSVPAGIRVEPGRTFRAYFFSEGNADDAASLEAAGEFVCTKSFGIGSRETIEVLTSGRELITEKRAP